MPLIRMSNTVFAAGDRDPADIIREVDHGWYLVGHRIPSIAESRENFRISARKVYEIEHGQLGRLYRDGGIMADTRGYLMQVDAVGSDFGALPDPQLRQGTTDADQEARQRRADDAQPRPAGRRLGPRAHDVRDAGGRRRAAPGRGAGVAPRAAGQLHLGRRAEEADSTAARAPTSSTCVTGTPTSRCTSRARARSRCGRSSRGRRRSPRPASSSSTEPVRMRWPGGPATSSIRSGGGTIGCSTKDSRGGTTRAIPVEGTDVSSKPRH